MQGFLDQSAKNYQQFIDIPYVALKGCCLLSLRDWQQESKLTLADLDKLTPGQYLDNVKKMFGFQKQRMMKLLVNGKEQEHLVDQGLDKVWEGFLQFEEEKKKRQG